MQAGAPAGVTVPLENLDDHAHHLRPPGSRTTHSHCAARPRALPRPPRRLRPAALRLERVPAIAALLARAAWWLPVAGREALADLGLAIYAFDDLVDESRVPAGDLELRAEQLVACARGERCREVLVDPTARLLRDVAKRLAEAPLAADLWGDWARASAACFRAMVGHRRAGEALKAGRGLSLDDYLALGRDSMGVVAACLVAAIVEGNPRAALQRESFLAAAAHAALRRAHRERPPHRRA